MPEPSPRPVERAPGFVEWVTRQIHEHLAAGLHHGQEQPTHIRQQVLGLADGALLFVRCHKAENRSDRGLVLLYKTGCNDKLIPAADVLGEHSWPGPTKFYSLGENFV